jgi:catechol 2,3-dioxygenase-like lactoylglutathione lyase family enzyme
MINAVHTLIHAEDAEKTRNFFRDVLGFPAVDAGHGWLIFALPPAELGIHPAEGEARHEIYLMCDDIERTVAELRAKGVEIAEPVHDLSYGLMTKIVIPGAGRMGLYQPKHPTPLRLG